MSAGPAGRGGGAGRRAARGGGGSGPGPRTERSVRGGPGWGRGPRSAQTLRRRRPPLIFAAHPLVRCCAAAETAAAARRTAPPTAALPAGKPRLAFAAHHRRELQPPQGPAGPMLPRTRRGPAHSLPGSLAASPTRKERRELKSVPASPLQAGPQASLCPTHQNVGSLSAGRRRHSIRRGNLRRPGTLGAPGQPFPALPVQVTVGTSHSREAPPPPPLGPQGDLAGWYRAGPPRLEKPFSPPPHAQPRRLLANTPLRELGHGSQ